jgi:ATP-dependent HslUV protease ATP-binding subunit HslU
MEELTSQIQGMFQQMGGARRKVRRMSVPDALKTLTD